MNLIKAFLLLLAGTREVEDDLRATVRNAVTFLVVVLLLGAVFWTWVTLKLVKYSDCFWNCP